MRETKKSPTSSTGKSTDVRPQVDTPKRSGGSVPVPLVTIDADAGASPEALQAGAALRQLHGVDTIRPVILARHALAEALEAALGPEGETYAPVLADVAVLHVIRGLTPEAVLVLTQGHPELVTEMGRLVGKEVRA